MTNNTDLEAIEQQYGFTFGVPEDHDTDSSPLGIAVACTNPDCPNLRRQIQLHTDTVQPVRCGGCHAILYCDHVDTLPVSEHGGTLGSPRVTTKDVCVACQTVVSQQTQKLPPIRLEDIPVQDIPAAVAAVAARKLEGLV